MIAEEHAGAAAEDFPLAREPNLRVGDRVAHCPEVNVSVPVDTGDACDFRLPVDLLQVHSERVEESKVIGAEGGAAVPGYTHAQKSDFVEHRAVDQPVRERAQGAEPPGNRLPRGLEVHDAPSQAQGPFEDATTQPPRI